MTHTLKKRVQSLILCLPKNLIIQQLPQLVLDLIVLVIDSTARISQLLIV